MKVRHVDYSPDEFLVGISGLTTADQVAVYWVICSLIYSTGRSIPVADERIRKFANVSESRLNRAVDALLFSGKLLLNGNFLVNPRAEIEIERAKKRSETSRANGKLGGRPPNESPKTTNSNDLENPAGSSAGSAPGSGDGNASQSQTYKPQTTITITSRRAAEEFETWWALVPHKVGRGHAERAFRAALKITTLDSLTAGIRRYSAEVAGKEARFVKHPATWLNGKCWTDEPTGANGHALDDPEAARWQLRVDAWKQRGTWRDEYGPAPDSPDCHANIYLNREKPT